MQNRENLSVKKTATVILELIGESRASVSVDTDLPCHLGQSHFFIGQIIFSWSKLRIFVLFMSLLSYNTHRNFPAQSI